MCFRLPKQWQESCHPKWLKGIAKSAILLSLFYTGVVVVEGRGLLSVREARTALRDELPRSTLFKDVGDDTLRVKAVERVLFRLRGVWHEGILHTEALNRAL